MARIVSLLASATETLCALGFESSIVGRSHECDYPASITHLPVCTEPKIDPSKPSSQIDTDVRSMVESGLSIYRVNTELLKTLAPDIIVTQDHCAVCAVSLADVESALANLCNSNVQIISLHPNSISDIWRDMQLLSDALDAHTQGKQLVASLSARLTSLRETVSKSARVPSVGFIEWISPLMMSSNWIPELIDFGGGHDLFGTPGAPAAPIEFARLVASDPDVVIVAPCGFTIERTLTELSTLERHPEWNAISAVRKKRVLVGDGNQYFNRSGPRLVEAAEMVAEMLHPSEIMSRFEGLGWISAPGKD